MLPSTLASASLRQTSRLRRHTGTKRSEKRGILNCEAGAAPLRMISSGRSSSVPQFAPGELDEEILEVRGPVQVAHAGVRGEIGKQRRGVVGIAERRLAGELEALRERASTRLGPCLRRLA